MAELKNMKINDEETGNVSGGAVFDATNIPGSDSILPYEVINETDRVFGNFKKGDVVARFDNPNDAAEYARRHGLSDSFIESNELERLRRN